MGVRAGEEEEGEMENQRNKYYVDFNTIGMETYVPLDYALGLEHRHLDMNALGGHEGRLERKREYLK